jgi:hypothetical protein
VATCPSPNASTFRRRRQIATAPAHQAEHSERGLLTSSSTAGCPALAALAALHRHPRGDRLPALLDRDGRLASIPLSLAVMIGALPYR